MILTIVFWWGLRSPKITPAKEKEKKIESEEKDRRRREKHWWHSVSILTTVDFKDSF